MNLFEHEEYKKYTNEFIYLRPSNGRGQYLKIAKLLNIHTSLVSQIFKGEKDLTPEHAAKLNDYFGHNKLESQYFLLLVLHSRAGNIELKKLYENQIQSIQEKSKDLSERLETKWKFDSKDEALFYSSWYYSALRILTSIPNFQTKDSLLNALDLSPALINEVLDFLVETGLCVVEKGKYSIGPTHTHLDKKNKLTYEHHKNWRLKAFEKHNKLEDTDLMFTAPLSIGSNDREKVRSILLGAVDEIRKVVDETQQDTLCCLNIDWIRVPLSSN